MSVDLLVVSLANCVSPTPFSSPASSERDFFRQVTRLESMDSYVLVSTLISSMSFGSLVGFTPSTASRAVIQVQGGVAKWLYRTVCLTIQVVAGLSTLNGLYATLIFSLTILYGKSALGVERDMEYDKFLQSTVRARVHGFRCFSHALGLFALLTMLVMLERVWFRGCCVPVLCASSFILLRLYKDWSMLTTNAETIYRDDD